jgi:uncharacterized protein YkwD
MWRSAAVVSLLGALVMLGLPGRANAADATESAAQTATTAVITGTVRGVLGGVQAPLPQVAVSAWRSDGVGGWSMVDGSGAVWTDAAGAFRLDNLPAGTYQVHVYPKFAPGSGVGQWWTVPPATAAATLTLAAGGSASAPIVLRSSAAEMLYASDDAELVALTNAARATGRTCGTTYYPAAAPLTPELRLDVVARRHAQDLAEQNYFAHDSMNGLVFSQRIAAVGFDPYGGENIAAGYPTPAATIAGWLASPGHCANMMSPHHTHLGVGKAALAGSQYGTYWAQEFYTNYYGQPGWPAASTPGSPSALVATAGMGAVALTWNAALANGAVVRSYTATANPGGQTCATTWERGCVIAGLTNGVSYTFTVRAVNSVGAGPLSAPSAPATPTSSTVTTPGAPTALVATAGDRQASVAFTPPASTGGAAITTYQYSTDNGSTWTARTPPGPASPVTIAGLTNGVTYQLKLRAVNTAGPGVPSAGVAVTPEAPVTVPAAPARVSGVPGAGQVTVAWTVPPTNGGSAITGYTVTSTPDGRSCTTTGALTCAVTGLTNGTAYTFTVTAANRLGASPPSEPSPAVTPRTRPAAPTFAVVTGFPAPRQAAVSWSAPASDGGTPVNGYLVAVSAPNSTTAFGPWQPATRSPRTLTGLVPGATYRLRLVSVNIVGQSPPLTVTFRQATVPSPVRAARVVARPAPGWATVAWSAPVSTGGTPVVKYLTRVSAPNAPTRFGPWTATTTPSRTLTGLRKSATYRVHIIAVNSQGNSALAPVTFRQAR